MVQVHDLIADPPKLHAHRGELLSDWRLGDETLLFLDQHVTAGMKTIETGAGISTVVFALSGAKHTCIVPDGGEVDRIRSYCDEQNISHTNVDFIIGRSEYTLPKLEDKDFDLALIDGRHGFPAPFIDWFYMAGLLKLGGILIIDDIRIWTCELLLQFLVSEEEWILLEENLGAAIVVKQGNNAQHKEWVDQTFVLRRSRSVSLSAKARYLLNLLRRGNLPLLWGAVALGVSSAKAGKLDKVLGRRDLREVWGNSGDQNH